MRRSVRRATVVLALTPLMSVPMGVAAFATSGGSSTVTSTPAPPGDASATAVDVPGVVSVGTTSAHAGSDGGAAHADAVSLFGQRVSGGDQTKPGSSDGNLIGTGATPLGDAELAPWSAKVTGDDKGYQAMAEAALAHVNLAQVLELWVLHSKSQASWSDDKSSGDAE